MHTICAVTHRKRPKRDHSGNCRKANAVSESAHISSSYTCKPAKIQLLVKAVRLSATDHDVSGADQLLDGVNAALHAGFTHKGLWFYARGGYGASGLPQ